METDFLAQQRAGGAMVRYGAECYSLLLDGEDLERPLPTISNLLSGLHEAMAQQQLENLGSNLQTSLTVRRLIAEQLADGSPHIDDVAQRLGLSRRSLQRALEREGAPFKVLLDETRRQMAHLYLRHYDHSLQRVADDLGFGEISSFHRACLRWFGVTPNAYRTTGRSH